MRIPRNQPAFVAALSLCLLTCLPALGSDRDQRAPFPAPYPDQLIIPGPLSSFLRMAGISQKVPSGDVLPELARSVFALGFRQGRETEFLVLLQRYVRFARELQALAAPNGEIRVAGCEEAGPLLQVLGYRLRNGCGQKDASLVTLNAENAFLTVDSGFPLTRLEEALQTDTPFLYSFAPSPVPVLLKQTEWINIGARKNPAKGNLLDVLLHDPQVARLYWAFSKLDLETGVALQRSPGLWQLLPYAPELDFYGTQFCIRSRRMVVPGGSAADSRWADLVGASPLSPDEFVMRVLKQDRGWLAVYFDTLSRVDKAQQAHLTQGARLGRFYGAFREPESRVNAAAATFPKAPELLVLFSRQQWLPDGEPRIPGNVNVWGQILGKYARSVKQPEQVLEAMVSASRLDNERGPLQIYLSLSELDKARSPQAQVSSETLLLMASSFAQFSAWYPIFSEFPELDDLSITRFIQVAESLNHISNQELRGNAMGTYQANIGLWQVLARQGQISKGQLEASWMKVVEPFARIGSSTQLFDAGEKSLDDLTMAAAGKGDLSQDELLDLVAGPRQENAEGKKVHAAMTERLHLVMDDQRLTSLDTLSELGRGLNAMAHGATRDARLVVLAGDLREFEMPRPIFTEGEKAEWAPGVLTQRHAQLQVHTDLTKVIEQPSSPTKLEAARGELAPFLRDTLVGLNYAYYEPPGSQILHINPLFVRSHDFSGSTIIGIEHVWQPSMLFGTGVSAGGGAYLVGSLADLPYVLAATEQNFISPQNVQALIWEELVPSLMASAIISRWWNVSPHELHAVSLYQQSGEEILMASAENQQLRENVLALLSDRMSPQRLQMLEWASQQKQMAEVVGRMMPADTFYLAAEYRRRFPQESVSWGPASLALDRLLHQHSAEVNFEHISRDFGIPHPVLAQTYGRDLVNGKAFPAFAGDCNRLFGESWDSSNLYWARLADEMNESPETLNILSPQLTRLMISKIFATDVEDWSAVARALHETGDEVLKSRAAVSPPAGAETAARR